MPINGCSDPHMKELGHVPRPVDQWPHFVKFAQVRVLKQLHSRLHPAVQAHHLVDQVKQPFIHVREALGKVHCLRCQRPCSFKSSAYLLRVLWRQAFICVSEENRCNVLREGKGVGQDGKKRGFTMESVS